MKLLIGLGFKLGFVPIFHFSVHGACSPLPVFRFQVLILVTSPGEAEPAIYDYHNSLFIWPGLAAPALQNSALQTEAQSVRIRRFCICLKKDIFFAKSAFRAHVFDGNKHRKHNFS